MKNDSEWASKMNKIKIFGFTATILFIFGSIGGLHEPSIVQGQGNAICGVLDISMVSCESGEVYVWFLVDGLGASGGGDYAMSIRACDGQLYNIRFCDMLIAYSGQLIKINNPAFGNLSDACGNEVNGIVRWSSVDIISSCSECNLRQIIDPCEYMACPSYACKGYDLYIYVGCKDGKCIYELYQRNSPYCGYDPCRNVHCGAVCKGYNLWQQECKNGKCVDSYVLEENSRQCGYDPCENVYCGTVCKGYNLWQQKCDNGRCVDSYVLEENSQQCGYNLCENVECEPVCSGYDLWSRKCIDGKCAYHQLIEYDSLSCGYDPCENHCSNGKKDCGEYGVDCGGGCLFIDSDHDGVEDCIDLCPNSRCTRVDANGCETDGDNDGVRDCEDDCPDEKGDLSNRGCPSMNIFLILASVGGVVAVGGSMAIYGVRNGRPPSQPRTVKRVSRPVSRPSPRDVTAGREVPGRIAREKARQEIMRKTSGKVAEEASKKAGTKIAEEASKKAGTKIAEEASKKAGTKIAEEASKKAGTKIAEEASKKAGTKIAEEASRRAGTKIAEEASKKAGTKIAEEASKKAGTKIAEEASKKAGTKIAEEASKKAGTKIAEEASRRAGTKIAEEASKKAGTKIAEEASRRAGTKIAEEASRRAGTKIAEEAIGAGAAAAIARQQAYVYCSNCGEKLSANSNFCSKCGYKIQPNKIPERDISLPKRTKDISKQERRKGLFEGSGMSKDQRRKNIEESHLSEEDLSEGYPRELSRHERKKMFFESLAKELSEMKEN